MLLSSPPQAENSAEQNSFLFHRKKASYEIKNAPQESFLYFRIRLCRIKIPYHVRRQLLLSGERRERMKITQIRTGLLSVPLRTPFKTALRTVTHVNDVIVEIHTNTGCVGYGEAPSTGVITGDTRGSVRGAI